MLAKEISQDPIGWLNEIIVKEEDLRFVIIYSEALAEMQRQSPFLVPDGLVIYAVQQLRFHKIILPTFLVR